MPITTSDFDNLTDDLQTIFNEAAKDKIADSVGLTKIFNSFDTGRRTFDHLILHGMAGFKNVTQGGDFPKITSEEGDDVSYTQAQYGVQADITKTMRKFDLYNQIETMVKSVVDDAFDKIDQSMADRISIGGWSSSYTDPFGDSQSGNGPDAKTLFNSAHDNNITSATYDNRITDSASTTNPALSRDAIVTARADALTWTDPKGLVRPINLDTIVVAPSNEDLAYRILESSQMSGTANNDVNPLRGKYEVIVWPRLESASDGTDTSAYWYMFDSKKVGETLKCLFAERPSLDAPDIAYSNKNWEFTSDFYYTLGTGFPAYIYGSDGSGS